jgi:hypothetical protein
MSEYEPAWARRVTADPSEYPMLQRLLAAGCGCHHWSSGKQVPLRWRLKLRKLETAATELMTFVELEEVKNPGGDDVDSQLDTFFAMDLPEAYQYGQESNLPDAALLLDFLDDAFAEFGHTDDPGEHYGYEPSTVPGITHPQAASNNLPGTVGELVALLQLFPQDAELDSTTDSYVNLRRWENWLHICITSTGSDGDEVCDEDAGTCEEIMVGGVTP